MLASFNRINIQFSILETLVATILTAVLIFKMFKVAFAAISNIAQSQTPTLANVTCISCYAYQVVYASTVLGTQYCPTGTVCNATAMNATSTSPCSASYSCGNQTANSTVFSCSQVGKFASLTSCSEYNNCRQLSNSSIVLTVQYCPGGSRFNNVLKLCTLSNVISCGNVTYIPSTQ